MQCLDRPCSAWTAHAMPGPQNAHAMPLGSAAKALLPCLLIHHAPRHGTQARPALQQAQVLAGPHAAMPATWRQLHHAWQAHPPLQLLPCGARRQAVTDEAERAKAHKLRRLGPLPALAQALHACAWHLSKRQKGTRADQHSTQNTSAFDTGQNNATPAAGQQQARTSSTLGAA